MRGQEIGGRFCFEGTGGGGGGGGGGEFEVVAGAVSSARVTMIRLDVWFPGTYVWSSHIARVRINRVRLLILLVVS